MFSMCSELTPRAHVPDNRIPQLMQPWSTISTMTTMTIDHGNHDDPGKYEEIGGCVRKLEVIQPDARIAASISLNGIMNGESVSHSRG